MSTVTTLEYRRRPSVIAYMLRAMLPAPRRGGLGTQIAARWHGHVVDRAARADFLRVTGLRASDTLSILEPHTFGFPLTMALLTHPSFPVPIWDVLQIRNHLRLHREIPLDARLDLEVRLVAARTLDKGAELDLRTELRIGAELAWDSMVTFSTRRGFPAHGAPSELARAPVEVGPLVERWAMTDDAHWRFCALTGDYNGVHTSDAWARRFGFSRALYHPARVLGAFLARHPTLSGARSLDAWLKGPVPHGAELRVHLAQRDHTTDFALFVEAQRPAILGRVLAPRVA